MHKTIGEARALARALREALAGHSESEVVLCPPFTALAAVAGEIDGSELKLGAQDVHWEAEGAYTGEVSVSMLKDVGCAYGIVGHSERRALFGERDEDVHKKAAALLAAGLGAIVCVGETLEQRRVGETEAVVLGQLAGAVKGLDLPAAEKLVIAYEPVWAIGTGENATGEEAGRVAQRIRAGLAELVGAETAAEVRIQYGGSVKPENIAEFLSHEDIDGALVGGASLTADSFAAIVRGRP